MSGSREPTVQGINALLKRQGFTRAVVTSLLLIIVADACFSTISYFLK